MFHTSLVLVSERGTTTYRLRRPLVWQARSGRTIAVPRGFRTDLASVPRPLWALFPPSGPYREAAVVHDFLLRQAGFSRKQADARFVEAMADLGIAAWRRWLLWAGVRVYGLARA